MEKVLVLGHRGLLGQALVKALGPRAVVMQSPRLSASFPPDVEGYAAAAARTMDELGPAWIINCAAFTQVDKAETQPEAAFALNATLPRLLATSASARGVGLVHISTDYVFDGASSRPYRESDPPNPLSVYGKTKLEGERAVMDNASRAMVVRTAWLFGPGRKSFVDKMVEMAREGIVPKVVTDQVGSPSYTPHVAEAIVKLVDMGVTGIVHVVNTGMCSRYELAAQAIALAGLDVRPVKVTSDYWPEAAARPRFSALDTTRLRRLTGQGLPTWLEGLKQHLGSYPEGG